MSEIAPSFSRVQSFGILTQGVAAGAFFHQQVFSLPAKFADIPVTAGIYFTATVDSVTKVSLSYLHIRQIDGSQATVEARIAGNHLASSWVETAVGKTLRIYSEARDISGTILSSDLVCEAVIQNIFWDGQRLKLYAIGTQDLRPSRTLGITTILFLQTRSSGQRSIRFPLVWGLQAGDTITHPDIEDFTIDTFSMTVQPKYKVIDASEGL